MKTIVWFMVLAGAGILGYQKYQLQDHQSLEREKPYIGSYVYTNILKIEHLTKTKRIHMTLMKRGRLHMKIVTIALGVRGVEESKQSWTVEKRAVTITSPFAGLLRCSKEDDILRCRRNKDVFVFKRSKVKTKLELFKRD